ncbi:MAG: family 43 glycosylhydrolase, partial [Allosphingosinicella sp.]
MLRAPDGYYYAYATQTERDGVRINLQVARSRDLLHWTRLGDALPVKPAWASRTWDFWAPHAVRRDGRYFLYFSAKPDAALADERKGLCLAVATAERPEGPFTDVGRPLQCGESFVNIDPMAFDDPATGKRLLYWGSGFQPIKVQELAEDRMSFAPGSAPMSAARTSTARRGKPASSAAVYSSRLATRRRTGATAATTASIAGRRWSAARTTACISACP